MKKALLVLMAVVLAGGVFSQDFTAYMTIQLKSQSNNTSDLYIFEASDFANPIDAENCSSLFPYTENTQNVNVFAQFNTDKYTQFAAKTISNLPIGLITNREAANAQHYQLIFSDVEGRELKLWDKVLDSMMVIPTAGLTYDFEVNTANCPSYVAGTNVTIADRFIIEPALSHHRDVANGNWATICFPYKFVDAAGVDKLYSLTAINTAGTKVAIDEVAIANVVAGKPYIFQSDSTAQEFKYKPENKAAAPDTIGSNGLCGVFADTVFTDQVWLVVNNAITLSAAGSDLVKYRCFIDLNQTPIDDNVFTQQVPGRRIFNVKNTPTGMEMLEEAPAMDGKMIINGQLIIIRDGKKFNAQGQEL